MSHSRPSCAHCTSLGQVSTCSRGAPCTTCVAHGCPCDYPAPPSRESAWSNEYLDELRRWPERASLKTGSMGSARLLPRTNKRRQVTRVAWEPAVQQREDLRIRPSSRNVPVSICPPSILNEHEAQDATFGPEHLNTASDAALLGNLASVMPNGLLPPTITLRSILEERPNRPLAGDVAPSPPSDINFTNCASVVTLDTSLGPLHVAAWRRGDVEGRPTGIGVGYLAAADEGSEPHLVKDSQFDLHARLNTLVSTLAPIQQVQLSPVKESGRAIVACRTATQLKLATIQSQNRFSENVSEVISVLDYSSSMLNRRPIAHFTLGGAAEGYGAAGSGLVVDTEGSLFGWGLGQGDSGRLASPGWQGEQIELFRLRKGSKKSVAGYSGFARVSFGGAHGHDAIIATEDEVTLHDLRSPTACSQLLDKTVLESNVPHGQKGPATVLSLLERSSAGCRADDMYTCSSGITLEALVTTRDVMWLDQRMPGNPVLSWSHDRVGRYGRGYDHTLSLHEAPEIRSRTAGGRTSRVALCSRIHPHVSIYTSNCDSSAHPVSLLDPYSLPSPAPAAHGSFRRAGFSLLSTSEKEDHLQNEWLAVDVDMNGSVLQRRLVSGFLESDVEDTMDAAAQILWTPEMKIQASNLERKAREGLQGGHVGVKEAARRGLRDMSRVKESLQQAFADREILESHVLPTNHELVNKAVGMLGASVAHAPETDSDPGILTGLDLANFALNASKQDVSESPNDSLREDDQLPGTFRRVTSFNQATVRRMGGLQELEATVGALDTGITTVAPWPGRAFDLGNDRQDVVERRQLLAPDLPPDNDLGGATRLLEARYGLQNAIDSEDPLVQDMSAACKELIADTALSNQLASVRPIRPNSPPPNINAPQSAEIPPPPFHLSYFRVVGGNGITAEDSISDVDEDSTAPDWRKPSLVSSGVRSLLGEWHMGTKPQSYTWVNPYADELAKDDPLGLQAANLAFKKRRKDREPYTNYLESSQHSVPSIVVPSASIQQPPSFVSRRISTIVEDTSARPMSASQPAFSNSEFDSQQSSQPAAAASQVVPGAFGGRDRDKKKKAKKRVSGF